MRLDGVILSYPSTSTNEPVIETSNLVKIYKEGAIKAVDNLNLKIGRGEIYALIGANGSGKTTTISMLTGSLFPTSGDIKVLGQQIPKKRRIISTRNRCSPTGICLIHRSNGRTKHLVLR